MGARAFGFVTALAVGVGVGGSALAADLRLGLGAGFAPDYEGSDDYAAIPLWNVTLSDLWAPETFVSIAGTRLSSNFLAHPHLRLGVSGQYVFERDDVEDDRVDEMRGIDASLLLGLGLGWDFLAERDREASIGLDLRQDVLEGNGFLGTLRGRWAAEAGEAISYRLELSSTYASEDYMSEYFGVSNRNAARSGLDRFDADQGIKDVTLSISADYGFAGSWSVTGIASYSRLLGDAADSPIVDDRGSPDQLFLGALVNYRF